MSNVKANAAVPIINYVNPEDGLTYQRVAAGSAPIQTFADGDRRLAAMPEGEARDALNSKLTEAKNQVAARTQGQALMFGARSMEQVAAAERVTDEHQRQVEAAIAALRLGTMSAEAAEVLYDQVFRRQREITTQVNSWRAGAKRAADTYADPVAAHDRLVEHLPILRTKPLI